MSSAAEQVKEVNNSGSTEARVQFSLRLKSNCSFLEVQVCVVEAKELSLSMN